MLKKNDQGSLDKLSTAALAELANEAANNVEQHARSAVQNAITAGRALIAAKAQVAHGQWLGWLAKNWEYSKDLANDYMRIAKKEGSPFLDSAASISEALRMISDAKAEKEKRLETREELFPETPATPLPLPPKLESAADDGDNEEGEDEEPVDWVTVDNLTFLEREAAEKGYYEEAKEYREEREEIQTRLIEKEELEPKPDKQKPYFTADEWADLHTDLRLTIRSDPASLGRDNATFNKQDSASIEWAQWSWNPVTGCKHDCPYCYARDIANRFYPQKFEPSIYPERFLAPQNTRVPDIAQRDVAYKNVFTCSMADLFGRWVPIEWIEWVMQTVADNSQWNFLFLTKFPQRFAELGELPSNAWMGTTVDCQSRVKNAEKAFAKLKGGTKWLSVEPMLTPLKFDRLDLFDWVVIGGASGSAKTPAWVPPFDWVVDLHWQARDAGCVVYHKDNLRMNDDAFRLREFPWEENTERQLPQALKYLDIE